MLNVVDVEHKECNSVNVIGFDVIKMNRHDVETLVSIEKISDNLSKITSIILTI